MERITLNQAMENHLRAIHEALETNEWATTSECARRLGISSASVTAMSKKLSNLKLVTYVPYQGVQLTKLGEKSALEIVRHHRLLELYLSEALGIPWDRVHDEAEKLEHVLSEELEERISKSLGDPTQDPHGAPIPARDGTIDHVEYRALSSVEPGETVTLLRVDDRVPEFLRYLGSMNLYPGTVMKVITVEPLGGLLALRVCDKEIVLGSQAAGMIRVTTAAKAEQRQ